MKTKFELKKFDVAKFDEILARGLSSGLGSPHGQMCIEAAICNVLGMDHDDDPKCVSSSIREYKISLNDFHWSSSKARAKGLRDLGLAQLGSKGVVDNRVFTRRLAEETIRVIIPDVIRKTLKKYPEALKIADECEEQPTKKVAAKYTNAFHGTDAGWFIQTSLENLSEHYTSGDDCARVARDATNAAKDVKIRPNYYLNLSAQLALGVLKELKSPGCKLLTN